MIICIHSNTTHIRMILSYTNSIHINNHTIIILSHTIKIQYISIQSQAEKCLPPYYKVRYAYSMKKSSRKMLAASYRGERDHVPTVQTRRF